MATSEGQHNEARGVIDAMVVGAGFAGLDAELLCPKDHPLGARRTAPTHCKGDTP